MLMLAVLRELERASVSKGWGLEVKAVAFKGDSRKAVLELRGREGGALSGWGVRLLPCVAFGGLERRMVATLTRCNVRREVRGSHRHRDTQSEGRGRCADSVVCVVSCCVV